MLHRAATHAYSWWWASHIRTKQSKWLEQNLHDVEEKVQHMMHIIADDGDSFAQRAEMYYRKRPGLISLVEEYFRAYRAIAERYDHLSRELQHVNRTMATVYPEKVQLAMDDEEENVPQSSGGTLLPKGPKLTIPKPPNIPKKDVPAPNPATSKRKQLRKSISLIMAAKCSGLSKAEALDEIDKLQKGILVLQTEKEFVQSSYERGAAKYWEIEKEITDMQARVSDLQDEFGVGTIIEDEEARTLMATTALKSCQKTLAELKAKQGDAAEKVRVEYQKLKETRKKLQAIKHQFLPNQTEQQSEISLDQESLTRGLCMDLDLLREKIKEQLELNSKTTVTATDVTDKIDELVEKVMTLEAAVQSQTALESRLRLETDELQMQIHTLEEEKETLMEEDSDSMSTKLRELEEELKRLHGLNRSAEDQNTNLQTHFTEASYTLEFLSDKLKNVNLDPEVEDQAWFQEERAVSDDEPEKEIKQHEDLLPQNNASVLSDDKETNQVSEKGVNPDCSSSVKAGKEIFNWLSPGNDVAISESMEPGNQEKKEDIPDPSHSAKAPDLPEEIQELKPQKEDEEQDLGHTPDNNLDIQDQVMGVEGDQPNWRQLFLNGLEHREKTLLDEYTSILRSYKEVKKKFSEAEKKSRDSFFESAMQIKELKNANALKDEEIRLLRQKIYPQTNPGEDLATILTEDKPLQQGEVHASPRIKASFEFSEMPLLNPEPQPVTESLDNPFVQGNEEPTASGSKNTSPTEIEQDQIKEIPVDESLPIMMIEEKIRADIDDILDENMEFWLRFSTSYHQIQKLETSIQDLQTDLLKLKDDKKNEGGNKQQLIKSDVRSIYTHMRELLTDLTLWMEHNALLKDELQGRFSSLCNLQDEISRTVGADSNGQGGELSHYQAAKFQGELLNMKQENGKVKEELQKGLDRVRGLQQDAERTLSQLDEEFEMSKPKSPPNSKSPANRPRIPLRSFLFGVKLKRQKPSFFTCMSPTLQKQYSDLTAGLPP